MYFLNVVYHLKDGKREAFLEKIKELGIDEKVRKENGCLKYDYYFSDADKNELLLVEMWESRDAQQLHIEQEHMKQLRDFKDDFVESTELKVFEI